LKKLRQSNQNQAVERGEIIISYKKFLPKNILLCTFFVNAFQIKHQIATFYKILFQKLSNLCPFYQKYFSERFWC
jgi:hypothetical protein